MALGVFPFLASLLFTLFGGTKRDVGMETKGTDEKTPLLEGSMKLEVVTKKRIRCWSLEISFSEGKAFPIMLDITYYHRCCQYVQSHFQRNIMSG